jgi:hypothetical protein
MRNREKMIGAVLVLLITSGAGAYDEASHMATIDDVEIFLHNHYEVSITNHSPIYLTSVTFDCISEDGSKTTHYKSTGDIRVGGWSPGSTVSRQNLIRVRQAGPAHIDPTPAKECVVIEVESQDYGHCGKSCR